MELTQLGNKNLILMRGYPGSGKSYTARQLAILYGSSAVIYSTDEFFHTDGDVSNPDSYLFDPTKLAEYHTANIQRTIDAMQQEIRMVIVDNTNLTLREMQPYVQAAMDRRYHVTFLYSDAPWRDDVAACFRKHTHGIPREIFETLSDKYQYPNQSWIDFTKILNARRSG